MLRVALKRVWQIPEILPSGFLPFAIKLMEEGLLPDVLVRFGIRHMINQRLQELGENIEADQEVFMKLVEQLKHSPIAIHANKANEQHYELPSSFFKEILGKNLKYSCCYYPQNVNSLDAAESAMLQLTCDRLDIKEGMSILELGCGWGSLTLWIAKHFPKCQITAVSNSPSQKDFIMNRVSEMGLNNVTIITCDMNDFSTDERFDRVASVEMFEHMRNYESLLHRIASWLKQEGKLFIHIFTHKRFAYSFETEGEDNWMGKYFFTGGIMPSDHLLHYFQKDLLIEKHWRHDGSHYNKTAEDWLKNMDAKKATILSIMAETYGVEQARVWFNRWRVFFMSVAELWGFHKGEEWFVSHYLFQKR